MKQQSKKKTLPRPGLKVKFDEISKLTAKQLKKKKGLSESSKRILSLLANSDQ